MARSWHLYPRPAALPPLVVKDPTLPLISVVTPSYNQGAFIRETIESVLSQDYPNIEHWVIDGGSTDNTLDILRGYADEPRLHWISERDRGQADAVNKGWSRCRGEIFGWLNSDDTYLPGALSTLGRYLQTHPEVDAAFGDALRVSADGTPTEISRGGPIDLQRMLDQNYVAQPTVLQRRSLVEQMGPLRIDLRFALDFDYYLRATLKHRFAYLPETIATYRMHTESKTVSGGSAFMAEFATVTDQLFCLPELPPELLARRRSIQSDAYLRVALLALRERQTSLARRCVLRACCLDPLRPRMLGVALLAFDTLLNTSFYETILAQARSRQQLRTKPI